MHLLPALSPEGSVDRRRQSISVFPWQRGHLRLVPQIPHFKKSECFWLLQNQPGGLIHIMDHQARRKRPRKLRSKHLGSVTLPSGSVQQNTSTTNHFNRLVGYSSDGFHERNPVKCSLATLTLFPYLEVAATGGAECFRARQLQRRYTPVMRTRLSRRSSPSNPCVLPSTLQKVHNQARSNSG
jgi:hypothetical protein